MGLKADAEAERTVIDQLNSNQIPVEIPRPGQGCRSPRCRAPADSQLIPLGVPCAQQGALPRRSREPANAPWARQLLPGAGARDWQPPAPAQARPPTQDKVQPPPAPGPPPPSPLCSAGSPRGARIRPCISRRRCGAARFQAAAGCPFPGGTMKVEFAPLNIPLARRLQTAAVLQWVLSFLLLGKDPARSRLRQIQAEHCGAPRSVSPLLDSPCPRTCLVRPSHPPSPVSQSWQVKEGVWS